MRRSCPPKCTHVVWSVSAQPNPTSYRNGLFRARDNALMYHTPIGLSSASPRARAQLSFASEAADHASVPPLILTIDTLENPHYNWMHSSATTSLLDGSTNCCRAGSSGMVRS